ncbi:Abi family protein [[Clostridium] innocuum]|mgnify:CR=1 FL=1|nr:Abi family protein [[Clostridium] innocuum]DAQ27834.1 MAG TPA: Abi-like protein [Caudoviricetes sp.]
MKPFKTIDEQYELLLSRGLNFSNKEKSKKFLLNNNYYNVINCYAKFFMTNDDRFIPGTNFDEITQVHYYDKEIKSIFFKSILEAEKHFKSILAYRFSEKYQDEKYAYLIASNYNSNDILQVTKTISSLSNIINKYKHIPNNPINHYIHRHGDVPFWILTNYMNFGQLLYFYKYLDDALKNVIAKDFSLFLIDNLELDSIQLTSSNLISYIENVIDLRNIVAHNNKLLGFNCKGHVRYLSELHDKYSISNDSIKQDVYNVFIVMQTLLSKNQYALLHNTLLRRTNYLRLRLKTIDINLILNSLGFPIDWYTTPKIPQPNSKIEE